MSKEQVWSLMSDTHCGSTTGLTLSPTNKLQEALLSRYRDALKWMDCEPDVVLHVGDGVDGKDLKGRDIVVEDMLAQAEDCAELIALQKPRKEVVLLTGTRYHDSAGGQEVIAHTAKCLEHIMLERYNRRIQVSVKRKLKTTINGWFMLEARHTIGGSSVPYGRATAPLRFQTWNILNAALESARGTGKVKYPNLLVFGHRHNYVYVENAWGGAVVMPCWQALGGIYVDEQCEGHCDLGLVKLIVGDKETEGWDRKTRLYSAGVVSRMEQR